MHLPDGFLSLPVSAGSAALSIGGIAIAVRRLRDALADRLVPTMGVLAAFIFAAQMFNFPVAGGTSGHLLGGVLAAIVVGPMAATLILTVVLIVQCLLFGDGGFLALGANILNMAILGTWSGWGVYTVLNSLPFVSLPDGGTKAGGGEGPPATRASGSEARRAGWGRSLGLFLASWLSVMVASAACAIELGISGTVPLKIVVPAMLGVHAIIGVGEGVITMLVLSFVRKAKPELLNTNAPSPL